ncbi:hypothetical protein MMC19_002663 [Ptychographa xylographoides]|nr:hypothetical protein [Ptychographa xylographoides]
MLAHILFTFWRIFELITLIPIVGMLAYFVNGYVNTNALTPNYILVLFIVSVLAAAWALVTLVRRKSTRDSAIFVAFIDLCFVGAFIGAVYTLRGIASANCVNIDGGISSSGGVTSSGNTVYINPLSINYTPFSIDGNKTCTMLKASFAFGIMNCIFFAITSFLALLMHRHERGVVVEKETYRRSSHGSRRGHSRSGSRRRTSRDSRRQYYV